MPTCCAAYYYMWQNKNSLINLGFTLLETLLAAFIGTIMCLAAMHSIFITLQAEAKIWQKFQIQFAKLIAKHYISSDLYQHAQGVSTCIPQLEACDHLNKRIKPLSSILIINTLQGNIIYYVRNSVIANTAGLPGYALYRDDGQHNAQALVEDVMGFKVQIIPLDKTYKVIIKLDFIVKQTMEMECVLKAMR